LTVTLRGQGLVGRERLALRPLVRADDRLQLSIPRQIRVVGGAVRRCGMGRT
jgi:hypothetical protein